MKTCPHCKIQKQLSEFSKDKTTKDNHSCWCKTCKHEVHARYRKNNKEQIKLDKKDYYNKNINKLRLKSNKNYHKNKVKYLSHQKQKYRENPDVMKNSRLKRDFGITLNDYNKMLKEQNHVCAICGKPETQIYRPLQTIRTL